MIKHFLVCLEASFLTSPPVAKFDPEWWSWHPGVKFSRMGEVVPQGEDPLFALFILLNIWEFSTLGLNEGVNNSPSRQTTYTPGGQLMLLKTGLWLGRAFLSSHGRPPTHTIEPLTIPIVGTSKTLKNLFYQNMCTYYRDRKMSYLCSIKVENNRPKLV
jgi:hypothetical protein